MGKEVVSPLVSIICNTYNHVNYIRQCLDGFLMQETNFPIEILVHDDASTDGTADIVREYEDKYPDLIKPIYQTENQYSKGVKVSLKYQYSRAKGKYIALCEGDDYWTDPLKLQKQVDFLEHNPQYVMCSHAHNVLVQNTAILETDSRNENFAYHIDDLVLGLWPAQTLTVLFRSSALNKVSIDKGGDVALYYFLLKQGRGFFIKDQMATYRIHDFGIWGGLIKRDRIKESFDARLYVYDADPSKLAAQYILSVFKQPISRDWYVKEYKQFKAVLIIMLKHLNPLKVFKFIVLNLLANKKN